MLLLVDSDRDAAKLLKRVFDCLKPFVVGLFDLLIGLGAVLVTLVGITTKTRIRFCGVRLSSSFSSRGKMFRRRFRNSENATPLFLLYFSSV